MNEVEMEHRVTAVEKLEKGNERRIVDLESDNKALQDLAKSVAVLAEQMKAINSKVDSMDTAVKQLQSVPGSRWEGFIKAAVTAVVAALVGWALGQIGVGA
nr:MAG TPA: hypothetical protein [Caudoviricetes sp.]